MQKLADVALVHEEEGKAGFLGMEVDLFGTGRFTGELHGPEPIARLGVCF